VPRRLRPLDWLSERASLRSSRPRVGSSLRCPPASIRPSPAHFQRHVEIRGCDSFSSRERENAVRLGTRFPEGDASLIEIAGNCTLAGSRDYAAVANAQLSVNSAPRGPLWTAAGSGSDAMILRSMRRIPLRRRSLILAIASPRTKLPNSGKKRPS
jgi:hypothetical protein